MAWLLLFIVAAVLLRSMVHIARTGEPGSSLAASGPLPRDVLLPFYERLVKALARYGLRRGRAETPLEFARGVVRTFGPEMREVNQLTNAFCAHRYGEAALTREGARELLSRAVKVERPCGNCGSDARSGAESEGLIGLFAVVLLLAGAAGGQSMKELIERLGDADPVVRGEPGRG